VGVGIREYWSHKGETHILGGGLNMVLLSAEDCRMKRADD
jgi:hypothetical protein